MSDLVEFLTARLAEDEQIARAAAARASDWHSSKGNVGGGGEFTDLGDPDEEQYWHGDEVIVYDEGWPLVDEATHIARHDPARVLREVEAKRALIESLRSYIQYVETYENGVDADGELADKLKPMAAIYSDHPGYDPKWSE